MSEAQDEQQIREVIATWIRATAAGDLSQVLNLMAEDVVFLLPGQPPMCGREAFATGFRAAFQHVRIEGVSDIQEIRITGGHAFCWSHLSLTITPLQGGSPKRGAGSTLSVFRKESDGRWRLFSGRQPSFRGVSTAPFGQSNETPHPALELAAIALRLQSYARVGRVVELGASASTYPL